jgi:DNA polymerase (family 10)
MTNAEIARALREMALFLDMDDVQFKPRAYEKAAMAVEGFDRPLLDVCAGGVKALTKVPSVGKGIAEKIEELVRTGRIEELEKMRKKTPVDVVSLTTIEGCGPKSVKALYGALRIRTVEDLERAARAGKIGKLPHFGEKSEQKILRGIEFLKQAGTRQPYGHVAGLAHEIEARLARVPGVERASVAGSIRRRRETIGDVDFLVVARAPERVVDFFVSMPEVGHVYARGASKTLVRLTSGLDADLRIVPRESFGAALQYFTGSKDHNIALRRIAQDRGLKLSEYGLFKGAKAIAGKSEEEVYAALGLDWVAPELRENTGEIDAAREHRLPKLIDYGDLRGDLQTQTNWTDGADSIEAMADEARRLGWKYIAITDHTQDLAMTRGCDAKKLLQQATAIRKINKKLDGFTVLAGAEVNIRQDGTLDIEDEALAKLDLVGVALHSYFNLPRDQMTRRLVRAMENPHVDILFHPTARAIGKRPPVDVDMDAVIEAARRTGTVLEIDAQPERLDLKDEHVRRALEAGVKLAIDSDAHRVSELRYANEYGIGVARRGWARKADVINALPLEKLRRSLKRSRSGIKS